MEITKRGVVHDEFGDEDLVNDGMTADHLSVEDEHTTFSTTIKTGKTITMSKPQMRTTGGIRTFPIDCIWAPRWQGRLLRSE